MRKRPKSPNALFISVDEAVDMLGIGRTTLYRYMKAGRIPHRVLPNGVKCFTQDDIDKILADAHRPAVA